jgi:hypothetical protein
MVKSRAASCAIAVESWGSLLLASTAIIVLLAAVLLWYVTKFADLLLLIAMLLVAAGACGGLAALVQSRWCLAGMQMLPAAAVVALGLPEHARFLLTEFGFYSSLKLEKNYLSVCPSVRFYIDGAAQNLGLCEILDRSVEDVAEYIIYDSSGEISRPYNLRTAGWKDAAGTLPNGSIIANYPLPVQRIMGPYYAVRFGMQDADRG